MLIAVVFCGSEFSLYEFSDIDHYFIGDDIEAIIILFNEFSHMFVVADRCHNFFEGLRVNTFVEGAHQMSN